MTSPQRNEPRRFGLTLGLLLLLWATLARVQNRVGPLFFVALSLGAILLLFAVAAPALLAPLHRSWMAIGKRLGWLNTQLLLSLFFCFGLVPIAMLLRLLGRDRLDLSWRKRRKTYWRVVKDPVRFGNERTHRPY